MAASKVALRTFFLSFLSFQATNTLAYNIKRITRTCAEHFAALADVGAATEVGEESAGKDAKKSKGTAKALAMPPRMMAALSHFGPSTAEEGPTTDVDEKITRAAMQTSRRFEELVYGPNIRRVAVHVPSAMCDVLGCQSATMAAITKDQRIPQEAEQSIHDAGEAARDELLDLQEDRKANEEKLRVLGIPYKSIANIHRDRVIQQFADLMANSSNVREYLKPLVDLVRANSLDYLAIVNHRVLWDQSMGQLKILLAHLTLSGRVDLDSNPLVRKACKDLVVIRHQKARKDLDVDSYATLEALSKSEDLTGAEKLQLSRILENAKDSFRRLQKARKRFVTLYPASNAALDFLTLIIRRDGIKDLESWSPMNEAWISGRDLGNRATLREIAIADIENQSRTYDHDTHRSYETPNIQEAYERSSTEDLDPIVIGGVFWRAAEANEEFEACAILELKNEIEYQKQLLKADNAEDREKIAMNFVQEAGIAFKATLGSLLSSQTAKTLLERAFDPQTEKVLRRNEPKKASDKTPVLDSGALPAGKFGLILLLGLRDVQIPWKPDALKFLDEKLHLFSQVAATAPSNATTQPSTSTPTTAALPSTDEAVLLQVTVALREVLQVLNEKARALELDDIENRAQYKKWLLGVREKSPDGSVPTFNAEYYRHKKEIGEQASQLFESTIQILYVMAEAVKEGGGTELDAQAKFAWHLKYFGSLSRIVLTLSENTELVPIKTFLTYFAFNTALNKMMSKIPIVDDERPYQALSREISDRLRRVNGRTWLYTGVGLALTAGAFTAPHLAAHFMHLHTQYPWLWGAGLSTAGVGLAVGGRTVWNAVTRSRQRDSKSESDAK